MIYRFENFELETGTRALYRNGERVHIEPKVLDLLLFLLRNRDRLVARQVLLQEIWPDVVVSEAALARLIMQVRRVLGDDGHRQSMIRTRRGLGIMFHADVRVSGAGLIEEQVVELERVRRELELAAEQNAEDIRLRIRDFADTYESVFKKLAS